MHTNKTFVFIRVHSWLKSKLTAWMPKNDVWWPPRGARCIGAAGDLICPSAPGTVREDYSSSGEAWTYFPFDHAHLRAFRWGEDGIAGICDNHQRLCFAPVFWNGRDPILKERLFGLSNAQGNHGEDVKELYYYLDSTPTHSYMKALYKYPQAEFPYAHLLSENARRSRSEPEFELIDTGVFNQNRYFDIFIEYAKADPNDILIRITAVNRGPDPACLHVLPSLFFRNDWSWHETPDRPSLAKSEKGIDITHPRLGAFEFLPDGHPDFLFTENDTNTQKMWQCGEAPYTKDAFHRRIIHDQFDAVNPAQRGTKACAWHRLDLAPGESKTLRMRLTERTDATRLIQDFDGLFATRICEADEFYSFARAGLSEDGKCVQRQAFAGLLWSKQFYHFVVDRWLKGDPSQPAPAHRPRRGPRRAVGSPVQRRRRLDAGQLGISVVRGLGSGVSHDPVRAGRSGFRQGQLACFCANGTCIPTGRFRPMSGPSATSIRRSTPGPAGACYKIDRKRIRAARLRISRKLFHKLLMNFTWWVNRKDAEGNNIFEGGFLGLDNIGVFDRSRPLPTGGFIEQSDGTSWMAMYCLNMMTHRARAGAEEDRIYEDIASKFFEHFLYIAHAMNSHGERAVGRRRTAFSTIGCVCRTAARCRMQLRSMVGLIPLFAVDTLEPDVIDRLPDSSGAWSGSSSIARDLAANVASRSREGMESAPAAHRWCQATVAARLLNGCWMRTNFYRRTGSVRFRNFRGAPFRIEARRPRASGRI